MPARRREVLFSIFKLPVIYNSVKSVFIIFQQSSEVHSKKYLIHLCIHNSIKEVKKNCAYLKSKSSQQMKLAQNTVIAIMAYAPAFPSMPFFKNCTRLIILGTAESAM
jgi:hypothetical protein